MITALVYRLLVLTGGTLYPAYQSYKAVKNKDVKEYVRWMMYWIVFAVYIAAETICDMFFSWFPFYYEAKLILIIYLVNPWSRGSSALYRNWVHPWLVNHEREIDRLLDSSKSKFYNQFTQLFSRGLIFARDVVATAAIRSSELNSSRD
uniref:Receptor expression-enhancing protein n=1 Tax=Panagrolaimus superbus TaxID=310955 RepID=A0A914Z3A1_9BILA